MQGEAIEKKILRSCDGRITLAFDRQVTARRRAVVGAIKIIYWVAKEKVVHTTKYESLLELAISRGCNYLIELHGNW